MTLHTEVYTGTITILTLLMITELKNKGYQINDPWDAVTLFEQRLAEYAGSKYAVCVDSCSNGIFLCLKYLDIKDQVLEFPKHTYSSPVMQAIHAGNFIRFVDKEWSGWYKIGYTSIIDAATRFCQGMYIDNSYFCVSFHHRKTLKIGKGGVILTNDSAFVDWCRPMIYDGRHKYTPHDQDNYSCIGYHMYMTPEEAANGLLLMENINEYNPDTGSNLTYKDLSKQSVFAPYIR